MNAVGDLGCASDQCRGARRVYQVLKVKKRPCRQVEPSLPPIWRKSKARFSSSRSVRNLTIRDAEKGLSTGERKMLDTASRFHK